MSLFTTIDNIFDDAHSDISKNTNIHFNGWRA